MSTFQLHVHVVEACNIPRTDFLTPSDLYMTLQLSTSAAIQMTSVAEQTQSPIWNQEFHFTVPEPSRSVLIAIVKNRSVLGDDTPLAKLDVPLSTLPPYGVIDSWRNMEVLNGQGSNPTVRLILQVAPDRHPAFRPHPGIAVPGVMSGAPVWAALGPQRQGRPR
jgi:hypothetical protein